MATRLHTDLRHLPLLTDRETCERYLSAAEYARYDAGGLVVRKNLLDLADHRKTICDLADANPHSTQLRNAAANVRADISPTEQVAA